jgi:high-affinity iron transporter
LTGARFQLSYPVAMLQSFVITLREGLEAFLIIAISLAYLRKTGRVRLIPAVHWGIVISIVASVAAGLALQRARNQALWEGVLALVAAVSVTTLVVHMWRTGRRMKKAIEHRLESSAIRAGAGAFLGVLGFTVLMIAREGMETALLMNTLLFEIQAPTVIAGAAGGTAVAAFIAWLWSRYGHRVNLAQFFQVTAVFLLVFVVQLVFYGFHELTEANIGIPNSDVLHWATEPYGPDGVYGQYLTYLLVVLPLGWLLLSGLVTRRPTGSPGGPAGSGTSVHAASASR